MCYVLYNVITLRTFTGCSLALELMPFWRSCERKAHRMSETIDRFLHNYISLITLAKSLFLRYHIFYLFF